MEEVRSFDARLMIRLFEQLGPRNAAGQGEILNALIG
jgi:hypothetical protein